MDISPIRSKEFADWMERLGPYEQFPRLAVAVSGGADSLALALLAAEWVADRQGRLVALTVDHGLRPESRQEAEQVGQWLRERDIVHVILTWTGPKPNGALQASARQERYRLLTQYCRENAILHLAVAHHGDDQRETIHMRRSKNSGERGLAGMSAIRFLPHGRLIRPFLGAPKTRLIATCEAFSQEWIEDPSNASPFFLRGRLRTAQNEAMNGIGCHVQYAGQRQTVERALAGFMAENVAIYPEGWASIVWSALENFSERETLEILAQTITVVGGGAYRPRRESVRILWRRFMDFPHGARRGWTLGGCRLWRKKERLVISREFCAIEESRHIHFESPTVWDQRFRVELLAPFEGSLWVKALGCPPWTGLIQEEERFLKSELCRWPGLIRDTFPALWDKEGLQSVPFVGWARQKKDCTARIGFSPRNSLGGSVFFVALP